MVLKDKLRKGIWRSDAYYSMAKKGSMDINHPGMKILLDLAPKSKRILDLGCGEGTRLNVLAKNKKETIGVDISGKAILLARKTYPKLKFIEADLENIPLNDGNFDLVYSAYVLEHLTEPEKVIKEAIRLVSENGFLVFIAPNYGAPNRASPPFRGSRLLKFTKGLLNDLIIPFQKYNGLKWVKVKPIDTSSSYDIDWDTTVEPYIGSLLSFLKSRNIAIKKFSTCWSEELPNAKIHQVIFRFIGEMGIYPFLLWGPHLVVVGQKTYDQ